MIEIIAASLLGSLIAALNHTKKGKLKFFRVFITGFSLAIFTVNDVVNFVQFFFNFTVSKGGILFMISLLGSELIERIIFVIRTFNVNIKWNKEK